MLDMKVKEEDRLYLAVGGGFGVHVHSGQVVRLQDAGVAVYAGQVEDLLPRTLKQKQV